MSPSPPPSGSTPIAVGLVGAGGVAEFAHLPTLARSRRGRLAAVVEPDERRRRLLARRLSDVPFRSFDEVLDDPGVPVVVVTAPTPLHGDMGRRAFEAGKHVYLEKPLAPTTDEGRAVVKAWREAGTVGMVGYNFRRSPHVVGAREAIGSGELGALLEVQGRFCWRAEVLEGWRTDPESGGGCLLDLASHHIDLLSALTGSRVRTVSCLLRDQRALEDTATIGLTMENDTRAQLVASFSIDTLCNELDLLGTGGRLRIDFEEPHPDRVRRGPGRGARLRRLGDAIGALRPGRILRSPGFQPSFSVALEAFLEAVTAPVPSSPEPSPATALDALCVVEAARRSAAREGARERVEYDDGTGGS